MSNAIFGPGSKVQKGFRLSKCDIRPQFECQNRISNVKNAIIGHSFNEKNKKDLEDQNVRFGPNINVKIGVPMYKCANMRYLS